MKVRQLVPWWVRICAKLILARLPVGYALWKRLGLFVHGDMNQPARALETFLIHADTAEVLPIANKSDLAVLELGPGDSVFTALIARTIGFSRTWMVDAGPFATRDPNAYAEMLSYLESRGYKPPEAAFNDFEEMLKAVRGTYLTDGVESLVSIPSESVDYCFSNAVLEHIPRADFATLAAQLFRVLAPDGVCVHRVDLKDHLGGGLNNLRFSTRTWESGFFTRSGFYTNRIRFGEMLSIFNNAGFRCEVTRKATWDQLPIVRRALAIEFRDFPDSDLCVSGFDVVLRKLPR